MKVMQINYIRKGVETNVKPLSVKPRALHSRFVEKKGASIGMFQGHTYHMRNIPSTCSLSHNHHNSKLIQLNRIVHQLQNDVLRMRRSEELRPRPQHLT